LSILRQSEFQFDLTGGNLALNFANTVSRRNVPERRAEHLETYADLVSFADQSAILPARQANELLAYARRHDSEARRAFRKAIVLREALYRAFSAVAQDDTASSEDLATIGNYVLDSLRHRALIRMDGGYGWQWTQNGKTSLDYVLWPISQSAADLLTSDELKMVRFCEAPDCEWLFLDRSRNRSRRWCDMTSCGNREKARRHYRRTHD
jgi:predicted RNA-binding Zn ribbon-like protein